MLSTDDVFAQVVTDGLHRRRRRRRRAWVAAPAVIALFAGALALRSPDRPARTTVSVAAPAAAPSSTLVIPAPPGGREVQVPAPMPQMPGEAPIFKALPPDAAFVQSLATALGVGGTVTTTANGFAVTGGATSLEVKPAGGVPGWRFETGQCPPGQCRPPDVTPTVPVPTVETRDAPDHPPFEAAPVAAEAARRIASALEGMAIAQPLTMSLAEWWASFQFLQAGQPAARSGFTAYIRPDGTVRMASGFLDRPGEPGPPQPLVGIDEALRRLAAAPAGGAFVGFATRCAQPPCPAPALVVTGVRLDWWYVTSQGFTPAYIFTVDLGGEPSERWIAAL